MLVQICWLLSLFLTVSTNALLSTSSAHHTSSSSTKKTAISTTSIHHTSSSSTKKTTLSTSSSHHTSSSSTKSSTALPTSTPSTFYLVAADTGETSLDGSYLNTVLDPYPGDTNSGDLALRFGGKTSSGAANFTLTADDYLLCNCATVHPVPCMQVCPTVIHIPRLWNSVFSTTRIMRTSMGRSP